MHGVVVVVVIARHAARRIKLCTATVHLAGGSAFAIISWARSGEEAPGIAGQMTPWRQTQKEMCR